MTFNMVPAGNKLTAFEYDSASALPSHSEQPSTDALNTGAVNPAKIETQLLPLETLSALASLAMLLKLHQPLLPLLHPPLRSPLPLPLLLLQVSSNSIVAGSARHIC